MGVAAQAQRSTLTAKFAWSSFYAGPIHYFVINGRGTCVINYTRDSLNYISMIRKNTILHSPHPGQGQDADGDWFRIKDMESPQKNAGNIQDKEDKK